MTDEEITKAILSVDEHDDLSKDMVEQVLTLFSLLCHEPHRTGNKTKTEMTRVFKAAFSHISSLSIFVSLLFFQTTCLRFPPKMLQRILR